MTSSVHNPFARGMVLVSLVVVFFVASTFVRSAAAVVIDTGDGSGNVEAPAGLRWWNHVESRLGGTTVIYLGDGWILTAGHVGMGVLLLSGERFDPDPDTLVTFGEPGHLADLIAFRLATSKPWPDLPLMEITRVSPQSGEEVLMIGNGHDRGPRVRENDDASGAPLGWRWGAGTNKRWGTNRVVGSAPVVEHSKTSSLAFATRFDPLHGGDPTLYEGQAASGDSGGAVFKRRDPDDPKSDWVLAGVMFTVTHSNEGDEESALYGDRTHSIDLAAYRDALIAAVRPACFDERDDDGDGRIDYPEDTGCESRLDDDEGGEETSDETAGRHGDVPSPGATLMIGAGILAAAFALWLPTRGSRTPR